MYRGLSPIPDDEVLRLYNNRTIPKAYVEGDQRNGTVCTLNIQLLYYYPIYLLSYITKYFYVLLTTFLMVHISSLSKQDLECDKLLSL